MLRSTSSVQVQRRLQRRATRFEGNVWELGQVAGPHPRLIATRYVTKLAIHASASM